MRNLTKILKSDSVKIITSIHCFLFVSLITTLGLPLYQYIPQARPQRGSLTAGPSGARAKVPTSASTATIKKAYYKMVPFF